MSNLDQLIDTIAHPMTGKAMRYDPTEYVYTGEVRWLAQRAREELAELRERLAVAEANLLSLVYNDRDMSQKEKSE